MEITKWDLFKQIDQMPADKYKIIKDFLDKLNEDSIEEVVLDKETKKEIERSYEEYQKGEFLTFDQVFEDDGKREV
ncbi:hypothetical protein ACFPN4_08075 [Ureibacillus thermophilus]|uniref:Uncharacterized protein n=2 Tax=Ureibacillus TaxID=160795 RepID=A0A4P6UYC8_9BACL|nr:hypothetical protein [Ureibacillus thermophilus]QBK26902.1 hypothetical protein DKZ56_14255 [Ureibacillus thermophilus]